MNALQSEIARLYQATVPTAQPGSTSDWALQGSDGQVRCAVLELARPANWKALGAVWHGVQADLALPAPAIAINGTDGYQLWFSWQQSLPADDAVRFLRLLCQRYLSGIAAERLRCYPSAEAAFPAPIPSLLSGGGPGEDAKWSAFLAPDLAVVFADEPWLDRDPGHEAQAQLLVRLQSMRPQDHVKALQLLQPAAPAKLPADEPSSLTAPAAVPLANYPTETPTAFLQAVMQDAAAPLALRVQAAAALINKNNL